MEEENKTVEPVESQTEKAELTSAEEPKVDDKKAEEEGLELDKIETVVDVPPDAELVKEAQGDICKTDILVCGSCHEVFHFVEEFQTHKSSTECTDTSIIKCENEGKSQAWGFALWKAKQRRILKEKSENLLTSWEFYQRWTKLSQDVKDLWITAGRNLQFCNKISAGKLVEAKTDAVAGAVEKDPLALDDSAIAASNVGKTTGVRTRTLKREDEFVVDQIVDKRFNPRKRQWEYEVKWENYDEHTWEPMAHLENCKALVEKFEKNKALAQAKTTPTGRGRGRPPRVNPTGTPSTGLSIAPKKTPTTPIILNTSSGRPQRSSKQKAMNQVKAWCGSISDEETGTKRAHDSDESDDSLMTKTADIDEDEPKMPLRKIAKIIHTYNNGAGRTKLPDNVLIPDAKGVVRISQKQLPSLSSGVYIMSKSSGIIKLDPAASKIATSGRQAIVKVSPRIGQTQIKIIKKEDGTKRIVQVSTPKTAVTASPTAPPKTRSIAQQIQARVVLTPTTPPKPKPQIAASTPVPKREAKKPETPVSAKKPKVKPVAARNGNTHASVDVFDVKEKYDSDDGIEDLEFPTDIPIPPPDSPPGDFTLDPFTGKEAGKDYPEKKESPSETIDNIVQLAAADITEDDLKADLEPIEAPTSATIIETVNNTVVGSNSVLIARSHSPAKRAKSSILNTALTNSNILQKTLQTSTKGRASVGKSRQVQGLTRTGFSNVRLTTSTPSSSKSLVRPPKGAEARPKFNIAPVSRQVKNTYTRTNNVAKRIGSTTVYKTMKTQSPMGKRPLPPLRKETPQQIISMPSLEEEAGQLSVEIPKPQLIPVKADAPIIETVEAGGEQLATLGLDGAEEERPMFITADDGTVYQVAGQNEEGQTILLAQDGDGQQCLVLTNEAMEEVTAAQQEQAQILEAEAEPAVAAEEEPLVAQFIRTEPPSPGGTHKVVVMLPGGDMMVTQVTPEEYASLELDK